MGRRFPGCTRSLAAMVVVAGALAAAPYAPADEPMRSRSSFVFLETKPNSPTAMELRADFFDPADPDAKPPAVRRIVSVLAPGARYDTSVPTHCTASDAELAAFGKEACPQDSIEGEGYSTADTGFYGYPYRIFGIQHDFFSNANEIVYLNRISPTGGAVDVPHWAYLRHVMRARVTERESIQDVPHMPGTPPDGGALDTIYVKDFEITRGEGADRRVYIQTPPECPKSRYWINEMIYTYADGVTQREKTPSPCVRNRGKRGAR